MLGYGEQHPTEAEVEGSLERLLPVLCFLDFPE